MFAPVKKNCQAASNSPREPAVALRRVASSMSALPVGLNGGSCGGRSANAGRFAVRKDGPDVRYSKRALSGNDHLRAEERFASACQEASKTDIWSTNGQCVWRSRDMAPVYADGGYRLTAIRVLAHCVHTDIQGAQAPQEQSSSEGVGVTGLLQDVRFAYPL